MVLWLLLTWFYIIRPYSALYHKQQTQSSAPEDGRNYRPKHVELIEIMNKIIILASSFLFILLYQPCTVTQTSNALLHGQNYITVRA